MRRIWVYRRCAVAAVTGTIFASVTLGVALAGPVTPGRAPAVQAVLDCRKIADSGERLACYDKAANAMEKAEATGDLVSVDREQRRAARHQAFGLPLPTLSFLDRGEKPEEVDRIIATVASASQDAYGKWTLHLDDGAVWRQIDDNALDRPPHRGSSVEIRRGLLGSFTVKIDGQFPIKMHRDR
jgi:hypothetical protein